MGWQHGVTRWYVYSIIWKTRFLEGLTTGKFSFPIIHALRAGSSNNRQLVNTVTRNQHLICLEFLSRKEMEAHKEIVMSGSNPYWSKAWIRCFELFQHWNGLIRIRLVSSHAFQPLIFGALTATPLGVIDLPSLQSNWWPTILDQEPSSLASLAHQWKTMWRGSLNVLGKGISLG